MSLVHPDVSPEQLEGVPQAVLDAVATALHRQLTTSVSEPPPGFDAAGMNSLVTFFRGTFPSEQNADPAAVRTNLRDCWVRLVLGMHQTGIEYGLAPIVVRAGAPCLVGVFDPGVDHQALARRRGLTVVRELGSGIVLFREGR